MIPYTRLNQMLYVIGLHIDQIQRAISFTWEYVIHTDVPGVGRERWMAGTGDTRGG
jgi:hypothetical protein